MQFVFDAIILVMLIIFTVIGVKKGFVRACAEFLGAIASAIAASMLGGQLASFLYNTFFKEGIYEKISTAVSADGAGVSDGIKKLFEGLPDFVVQWLSSNGITAKGLEASAGQSSKAVATVITDTLSPVFISLIKVFVVIILFLLFMIIIKAIANLLSGIFSLPILRQINGLLGGVCGLFLGTIVIWIVVGAVQFFEPMMASDLQKDMDKTINNSIICKYVVAMNPVKWIFD